MDRRNDETPTQGIIGNSSEETHFRDRIFSQQLTHVALDDQQIDGIVQTVPGGAKNIQDIYPLSPLQEGILFHHLLNDSDTYVLSILLELPSKEHVRPLIDALQKVVDRHDILRTAVRWENLPRPVQIVYVRAQLTVEEIVLDQTHNAVEQLKEKMKPQGRKLDLRQAPLAWLHVAADAQETKVYALLRVHHLVCDHQSLRSAIAEALAFLDGREHYLPTPAPYRQYIEEALASASPKDAEAFFRRKFSGVDQPTAPFGVFNVHGDGSQIEEAHRALNLELCQRLRFTARRLEVSAARVFHAAWALVVAHTTGLDDVVYGTVVLTAKQRHDPASRILGMSVNTLPLRLQLKDATAKQLVERTESELAELLEHEQAPLTLAQRCSDIGSTTPLFTTLLNYRHSEPDSDVAGPSAAGIRMVARGEAWTNYPITFLVDDLGEGFVLTAQTDRRIDPHQLIEYMHTALQSLVEALESAPQTPALALAILPQGERRRILEHFNAAHATYTDETLIHELFEGRVRLNPTAVAIVYEGESLTYAELNSKSNQVARCLRERGVGPDQLVALCFERSLEMVVGLLGILKAGGAYVPLDPNYPAERLTYMLEDSAPAVLLTEERFRDRLPQTTAEVITLDSHSSEIATQLPTNLNLRPAGLTCRHLAYVIYTSGSTGKPKGVMVEHRNVTRLFAATDKWFHFNEEDVWTLFHSVAFDFSVWELWGALLYGGRAVVVPYLTARSPGEFYRLLCDEGVTVLNQTPTAFLQLIAAQGVSPERQHSLRVVIFGGEALEPRTLRPWIERNGATRPGLINMYGITETTVHVTYRPLTKEDIESPDSGTPIGSPIPDLRVYLLDRHQHPVPIGVPGEIYVGGAGVARGYLNRPELTTERFFTDPFNAHPHARVYRTGDLGKWRSDGDIEYLGRNDHQIKIRGYRIELGEIEAQLLRHVQVREAVVIARDDSPGDKRLVAYVVPHPTDNATTLPTAEQLRTHLKSIVPEHMIPSAFVLLDHLPLTSNGKLDRRALPIPRHEAYVNRQYEAPEGEVEELLVGIWEELLPGSRVGRQDSFFELGGHSLLIVQMLERLRRVGLSAPVRSVFESPTLTDLARMLTSEPIEQFEVAPNLIPLECEAITPEMLPLVELEGQHIERIVQSVPGGTSNIQDIYPLTPLQEGMLFHHLLAQTGGDTYVVPTLLSVSSRERLEELIAALQSVIDRHDILRTAVLWEHLPRPLQVVYRQATLPVEEVTLERSHGSGRQIEEWIRPERQRMDLRQAPLLRLQVAEHPQPGHWCALLQIHHMVDDATSLRILISEVVAHLEGRAEDLPEPVAYRTHVAQAITLARTLDSEAFFRATLKGIDEPTAPFGLLNVHEDGSRIDDAHQELEVALAMRVRTQARRLGVTVATLFHAAWGLVVARTSRRDDVVFGTVLLGRLQGSAGAQRIVGMFVNTLPLRLQLQDITARELVTRAQRALLELLRHEQASLAMAQRCSEIPASEPLFTAVLNFRHSQTDPQAQWDSAHGVQVLAFQERTNYPITLSIDDRGQGFSLTAQTARQIEPHRLLGYLHTALQSLLDALELAPQTPINKLSVLPTGERYQLIKLFNATQTPYPQEKLIHQLFEEQVRRNPEAVAVVHEGTRVTYAELNGIANQLAHYLCQHGLQAGEYIPLLMSRSLEMVIAQLAVLKSGGAYVPIDPELPLERQTFMIRDCGARRVLADRAVCAGLKQEAVEWMNFAELLRSINELSRSNLDLCPATPQAYVMYTSGSTGIPKGVIVPHRAVIRLVINSGYVQIEPTDCIAHCSNPTFDASTFEIWGALLNAASVLIVPQPIVLQGRRFAEVLRQQHVTVLWLSVGLFAQYTGTLTEVFAQLRYLLVGGDIVEPAMVSSVLRSSRPRFLLNAYGPTECTTFSTTYLIEEVDGTKSIPIGRPISNTQIYILDSQLEPVPLGVTGEIYIGGAGVALGYLNRPQLTAERFVIDPFNEKSQTKMYRSGDLGRWRGDGTVEFLGRCDEQVKIRGHRVEVGEIEAHLQQHPLVKTAAVVAREDEPGEKRLVAYVVADLSELKKLRPQGSAEAGAEIVTQWEQLYEETYSASAPGPTFVGWNSSYTGQPIPEAEMREWLQTTLERIYALKPRKVLEIGCGVGLLLQHLAPRCPVYVGTDFSASALNRLRHWLSGREDLTQVELLHREATELQDLESGSFDTVLLNSVVQYFPDIEYLFAVLQQAVRLLSPGGKLFIGDVRHLGLLTTFHSAVQLGKAAATVTVGQLRRRIARAVAQDKELVIDPRFFHLLTGNVPGITAAEVQLKRGSAANELSRYRYDITLHIGEQLAPETVYERLKWETAVRSIKEFEGALRERRWATTRLSAIPNGRLSRDSAAQRLIEAADETLEVGALRRQLSEQQSAAVDPETICELAELHGYDARVSWDSQDSAGCFEIELLDRAQPSHESAAIPARARASTTWSDYANNPLENSLRLQIIPQLREYLHGRLPEFMMPSAWLVLKQLPLTRNGKVDRRALPAPQSRPEELGEYIAPRTELERTLANIWAQVLRVDQVGVQDNFFELGGHSLLAIRALSRINQCFGTALTVIDMYKSATIRSLANRLDGNGTSDEFVRISEEAILDPDIVSLPPDYRTRPQNLLLTGATGFVGRFLLAQLLHETDATIHCVIRAQSRQQASSRLQATLSRWNLWRDGFERRIVAIPGDLSLPCLGASKSSYRDLCEQIDSIYHCGTSMNHLETYTMAKPANVEGARELLKIATRERPKLINYISTLGVFSTPFTDTNRVVDEESPIDDERHPTSHGYVASKWISEKIFMLASERGIPCNIFRLGLVWADTQQGRYDPLQRGHRIFKSCLLSGYGIKGYRYEMPPTPVDYVARAVVYLANEHYDGRGIYHISSTEQMAEGIFERCNEMAGTALKLIPFYEWTREMKRLHDTGRTMPAVPLIEYAFSLDKTTFEDRSVLRPDTIRFDCARTHAELGRAGIVAPILDDDLLRRFVESMSSRDVELRETLHATSVKGDWHSPNARMATQA
jgi:amino acid adenylation domain-containing protein/thioester reductase-like protein